MLATVIVKCSDLDQLNRVRTAVLGTHPEGIEVLSAVIDTQGTGEESGPQMIVRLLCAYYEDVEDFSALVRTIGFVTEVRISHTGQ